MIIALITAVILLFLYRHLVLEKAGDHLSCTQELNRKLVEPDETFVMRIRVINRSFWIFPYVRTIVYLPQVFEVTGMRAETLSFQKTVTRSMMILPRQTVSYDIKLSCPQRGRYVIRDMMIRTGDSFGLSSKLFRMESVGEIVVIPRRDENGSLPQSLGGFLGNLSVRRFIHEDPVLHAGFREYTGREPMRNIAWSQSAKGLGLMVRTPDYTADPSVCLILNIDSDAEDREALTERCLMTARTVAEDLERQKFAFRMMMNAAGAGLSSLNVQHGFGEEHYRTVMEMLGRASYVSERTYDQLLRSALDLNDNTAGYLIITPSRTDRADPELLQRMSLQSGSEPLILCGEDRL